MEELAIADGINGELVKTGSSNIMDGATLGIIAGEDSSKTRACGKIRVSTPIETNIVLTSSIMTTCVLVFVIKNNFILGLTRGVREVDIKNQFRVARMTNVG